VLVPPAAVERAGWPRTDVVDLRVQPPGTGLLTDDLVDAVRASVDQGAPAVLVLNRRGGVRLLRCDACHELTRWDANGRPVWDDTASDDVELRPTFCVHCGGQRLRVLSGGVQRLAEHLAARLAGREVAVVDAAVAVAPDAPVLVGTEAVLHRREVRRRRPALVALVDFDAELYAARARAAEQALWLGVRAAHVLAGAPRVSARLVLQTHEPEHEVVRALVDADPGVVAAAELERRRRYDLPPFTAVAQLRGDASVLDAAIDALAALDLAAAGVRADRDGERVLVRAPDGAVLADALRSAQVAVRSVGPLRCAVDPPRL
jgi:primosomal protein N' (replication factor Y)